MNKETIMTLFVLFFRVFVPNACLLHVMTRTSGVSLQT